MSGKRILVLSPHPDDESFSCAGTIVQHVKNGDEVIIVVVADGRHGLNERIKDKYTPEELIPVRRREMLQAGNIMGVKEKNIVFLAHEDGMLGSNLHDGHIQEELVEIIEKKKPASIYLAITNNRNPDHQAMLFQAFNAIKKTSFTGEILVAVPKKHPVVNDKISRELRKKLKVLDETFPIIENKRVDISNHFEKKIAAILAHDSQMGIFSSHVKKKGDFIKNVRDLLIDVFKDKKEEFQVRKRRHV
ncbi:MAG: PIG-L deacetylase family protein [Promethearchaeota archaeon]